jgi:hypothetical protein
VIDNNDNDNNIYCRLYLFYGEQEKCRQRAVDKVKDQCCIYQQKLYSARLANSILT